MTLNSLRKTARHVAPSGQRWKKRLAFGIGILILMAATAAVAVIISQARSADDVISAQAVGSISIGSAATQGIFQENLSGLKPGDSFVSCVNSIVTDRQSGDTNKAYAHTASGPLASSLQLKVWRHANAPNPATPGHVTCLTVETYGEPVYSGTLAGFASAHGSWNNGIAGRIDGISNWRFELTLPSTVNPTAIAGQTATLALNFENRTAN